MSIHIPHINTGIRTHFVVVRSCVTSMNCLHGIPTVNMAPVLTQRCCQPWGLCLEPATFPCWTPLQDEIKFVSRRGNRAEVRSVITDDSRGAPLLNPAELGAGKS